MKKRTISIIIILLIIIFAIYVKTKPEPEISKELAKCIGENSIVYSQTGCHFCEVQKEMFGENYKYINEFLCGTDKWVTCTTSGITGTPTWKINGEFYKGVQTIEKLKELTKC